MASVTGLFFIDGGKLFDEKSSEPGPNRLGFYRSQSLPALGFVFPGLHNRLNASGFNYFANMNRELASGGLTSVFTDRPVQFFRRGNLTTVTGDRTPVLVMTLTSGDFRMGAAERSRFYNLQLRSEVSGVDTSRKEIWPPFDLEIVREV